MKASGSKMAVLCRYGWLKEFLLDPVLELQDIYRVTKRILKEDVVFRLRTERQGPLI